MKHDAKKAEALKAEIQRRFNMTGSGQPFLMKVVRELNFLDRLGWDSLSSDLQAWSNAAVRAANTATARKEENIVLPELGDDVPPAAAAPFLP
jgi:hypothetical protein